MKKIKAIPLYLLFIVLSLLIIYPVFLVILISFKDTNEINKIIGPVIFDTGNTVNINYFIQYPTLSHFKSLLIFTPEFYTVFWNSFILTGTILLFQVVVAVPAAWAFTRFKFRGRKLLFNLYVILMLMPFQITMLSQYLVLNSFNMINTKFAIILPAVFSTLPVFIIYRGFSSVPEEILDSARMDGANEWGVLWYIGLPLGKSGILACIVLCFLDYWNMVEQPLAFLKDKTLWPLSLYLPSIDLSQASVLAASSVITLIPAVFVFIIGQDYLEQGIISSALKE